MKSVIVVGQGIAGTVLAESFLEREYQVYLFDSAPASSSSLVAAGIYNPIIAKRITQTWMAKELLSASNSFYERLDKIYDERILFPLPLYMVFESIAHQNNWAVKSQDPNFECWTLEERPLNKHIKQPFGGQWMNGSGYINTQSLIKGLRNTRRSNLAYFEEKFNFDQLKVDSNGVRYQSIEADYIFFCEGIEAQSNPFFRDIPFKPAKGELLRIKIEKLDIDHLLQAGIYLLPLGNQEFILGATYDWRNLNELPTPEANGELLGKLRSLIELPVEVIEHKAGIRPAIADRRPVLGFHEQFNRVGIFNGLGTKGIMLAPFFAAHLIDAMEGQTRLMSEVSISRFQ